MLGREGFPAGGNVESQDGDTSRKGLFPWIRRPREERVTVDLAAVRAGETVPFAVPDSVGLEVVCLVRPTTVRTFDGDFHVRAVSVFVVNTAAANRR